MCLILPGTEGMVDYPGSHGPVATLRLMSDNSSRFTSTTATAAAAAADLSRERAFVRFGLSLWKVTPGKAAA
jgi:hypothetical protein